MIFGRVLRLAMVMKLAHRSSAMKIQILIRFRKHWLMRIVPLSEALMFFIRFWAINGRSHRKMIHQGSTKVGRSLKSSWISDGIDAMFQVFGNSPSSVVPFISSSPIDESSSFYSSSNSPVQSFRKNFRCRLCRLTYKVRERLNKSLDVKGKHHRRIFMTVRLIFERNMKSAMSKQVDTSRNSIRMFHCRLPLQGSTKFVWKRNPYLDKAMLRHQHLILRWLLLP